MEGKSKVIAFWSPVSGVGTTFTVINIARAMSKKGLKVAVLDYDLKTPAIHIYFRNDDTVHCLDNVIPFTAGGNLTPKVMESNLQQIEDFYLLRGTNSPEQAQYIKIESLDEIIQVLKGMFDYVLIDTQSIVDNAGTYVALNNADKVFVLTEKNVISIQHYDAVKNIITSNFDVSKFQLLINKCSKDVFMEKVDVENYFSIPNAFELPLVDSELINAINQGRWVAYLNGTSKQVKPYNESVAKLITERICGDFENMKDVKKSGFSLFGRK